MIRSPSEEFWNNLTLQDESDQMFALQSSVKPWSFDDPMDIADDTRESSPRSEIEMDLEFLQPSEPVSEDALSSSGGLAALQQSAYAPWTLEEDTALMTVLVQKGAAASCKLGERAMQELGLGAVPVLSKRSFKAIYNRYNKHLQWRFRKFGASLTWLAEMHAEGQKAAKRLRRDEPMQQ